jgi:uncharacterized membrane protein YphA (DoxX/SURF4 family)
MFGWLVRLLLIVAGLIVELFVSKDAPNFGAIQAMATLILIAFIVFVIAFWPARWSHWLDRFHKRRTD